MATKFRGCARDFVGWTNGAPEDGTVIPFDFTMPRMDGEEIFRLIREPRPAARVLPGLDEGDAIALRPKLQAIRR